MRWLVFNQKGGVGKSTICTNLAAASAVHEKRTLLVDLDVQGNSTYYAGCNVDHNCLSVADLFTPSSGWFSSAKKIKDCIVHSDIEHLDIMPSSEKLSALEKETDSRLKLVKLKEALDVLDNEYDEVWIDTSPSFNFCAKAAMIAADAVVVPIDCDLFSVQSVSRLMDNVLHIKQKYNPELVIVGIVVNQFSRQANYPKRLVTQLQEQGMPLFDTFISSSIKIKESHEQRRPIVIGNPGHDVSKQLYELFDEIMDTVTLNA